MFFKQRNGRLTFTVKSILLLLVTASLTFVSAANAQTLAFPGAEGFGRYTTGGGTGSFYIIDSLADSGPGTLRGCIEASGPRVCIFKVSGNIQVSSTLLLRNGDVTILGQTAPDPGIIVTNAPGFNGTTLKIDGPNWIIRHLAFYTTAATSSTDLQDGISVCDTWRPCSGILDHVAIAGGTDELVQIGGQDIDNLTISNNLFFWPLDRPAPSHPGPPNHGYGPYALASLGFSMVGNLMAHGIRRMPNITGGATAGGGGVRVRGDLEFRNNVTYNCGKECYQAFNKFTENWTNLAGNVSIFGADTQATNEVSQTALYPIECYDYTNVTSADCQQPNPQNFCVQDNSAVNTVHGSWPSDRLYDYINPQDASMVKSTDCVNKPVVDPLYNRGLTGAVISDPAVAEAAIVAVAGPRFWDRDNLSQSAIDSLTNRTGTVIDNLSEVGGVPSLAQNPGPADTDSDGIPDVTETACGWNPDVFDSDQDLDLNGWTNFQQYSFYAARDTGYVSSPCPANPPGPTTTTAIITANPANLTAGNSTTLTWTSTDADSCTATSGNWSSNGATFGTQTVSPTSNATYSITCTGAAGTASASVSVSVTQPPPGPSLTNSDSSGGGGGAIAPLSLLLLSLPLLLIRLLRQHGSSWKMSLPLPGKISHG